MKEISIGKVEEGQRLDRFLGKCLPNVSSGFLHKMLRKKNIELNGKKADGSEKLRSGDRIQIFFSDETYEKFSSRPAPDHQTEGRREALIRPSLTGKQAGLRREVKLLYHDDDIVILHKPAGMLSQKSGPKDDSLNDYLQDLCIEEGWLTRDSLEHFHPSVANRLDRNTSGIVLCGISTKGLQFLSRMLQGRDLSKYYLALVAGPISGSGLIKSYLKKDEKKNRVFLSGTPGEGSKPIETRYQVLAPGREVSLVKICLVTGKSHQIRAHLAGEGYPILGDPKYGDKEINRMVKKNIGIAYQMLHAYEIDFGKYLDGLVITDEIPEAFRRVMDYYGIRME